MRASSTRLASALPRVSGVVITSVASGALVALVASSASVAHANELVTTKEARLLRETGENTTVIDAFDDDDPFDLNLSLTLRQQWKSSRIRRETALSQGGLSSGGFVSATQDIASYSQSTTTLEIGADIGLYKDLALAFRVPLVLADARELSDLDGSSRAPDRLVDPAGGQLFSVPFKSPTRRGLDWFSVGLAYAIMNQQRESAKPTWVVGFESRFGVGPRLRACNENAAVKCPDPVNPSGPGRDPGISRGMTGLVVHTTFSRRIGAVEPYVGLRGMIELPTANGEFGARSASVLVRPPVVGTVTIGTEVFPWENREAFKRVGLDFRVRGSYHSPGRDYSELFDALGTSQATSLRSANAGGYHASPNGSGASVVDPSSRPVYFTGITDSQAFGSLGGSFGVTWQTSEYVKVTAGIGFTHVTSHLVTAADACNPDANGTPGTQGPCGTGGALASGGTTGVPNPNHRQVIDLPGRRFSVDDTTLVDLWLSGTVMF